MRATDNSRRSAMLRRVAQRAYPSRGRLLRYDRFPCQRLEPEQEGLASGPQRSVSRQRLVARASERVENWRAKDLVRQLDELRLQDVAVRVDEEARYGSSLLRLANRLDRVDRRR